MAKLDWDTLTHFETMVSYFAHLYPHRTQDPGANFRCFPPDFKLSAFREQALRLGLARQVLNSNWPMDQALESLAWHFQAAMQGEETWQQYSLQYANYDGMQQSDDHDVAAVCRLIGRGLLSEVQTPLPFALGFLLAAINTGKSRPRMTLHGIGAACCNVVRDILGDPWEIPGSHWSCNWDRGRTGESGIPGSARWPER